MARTIAVCVCVLALLRPALRAQAAAAALAGVVTDASGAAIAGAEVTVARQDDGVEHPTTSGRDGRFEVAGLTPGRYRVRVALQGFRTLVRADIALSSGETQRVDLTLWPARLTEAVDVTARASPDRRTSAGLGQVIDGDALTAVPLNGRTFISLANVVPGVALPPGSLLPRINGGRPRVNEYLFDGISVLQPEPGQVPFFPNIDAIEDVRIETNSPPAEFGRFNGGVVSVTTRSGSNVLHGSGFDFVRHERLNARPVFSAGESRPRFRRQQFGGVAGGPLRRNRTFFFADYQGQRQSVTRTAISTVPTTLQRLGIFTETVGGQVPVIYDPATTSGASRAPFPGNAIPPSRMDTVAVALLQRYPLPTAAGTANNYRRLATETVDHELLSVRLDEHRPAGRDAAFVRLTRFAERVDPATPLPDGSGVTSGTSGPQQTTAWAFASAYRRVGSRYFHELRAGHTTRAVTRQAVSLERPASAALGLPGLPADARFADTLPTFLIAGYQQIGSSANTASDFRTRVTQVANTLTMAVGRHTIKVGSDVRWAALDVVQPSSPTGAFTFSALFTDLPGVAGTGAPLASFLLGQVERFSIDVQRAPIRNRAHIQEYFAQDEWAWSRRLTINAGLRYTLNFPSTEVDDQAAVFNLQTQRLDYLGRGGQPRSARRLHRLNIGPRLGLVVRPTDQTAVRAAYAMVWIDQSGITTPFTTPAFPFVQTVTQRTLDNGTPAFALSAGPAVAPIAPTSDAGVGHGVFAVDRDLGSGYVQQWSTSFRREVSGRVSFELAYVGSAITRVGLPDANVNQLTVDQLALGPGLLERVPNPYFGSIPRSSSLGDPTITRAQLLKPYPQYTTVSLYRNNVGTTRYDGLSAHVEQRLTRGLSYLVSYTRSRLVDDASAVFDAAVLSGPVAAAPVADSFDRRRDRDYSTGDVPHVLVASGTWRLPDGRGRRWPAAFGALIRGWSVSGVLTVQSGVPVAVTQATNSNAFAGFGVQRPNLVGTPELPPQERSASRWFNTDAFAEAPVFTLGSASRNPVRGPGYRNVDIALTRQVALGSSRRLELRAEVFNATNTPALGSPNGVFGSAAFGSITTAGDPRAAQLAVKLLF